RGVSNTSRAIVRSGRDAGKECRVNLVRAKRPRQVEANSPTPPNWTQTTLGARRRSSSVERAPVADDGGGTAADNLHARYAIGREAEPLIESAGLLVVSQHPKHDRLKAMLAQQSKRPSAKSRPDSLPKPRGRNIQSDHFADRCIEIVILTGTSINKTYNCFF